MAWALSFLALWAGAALLISAIPRRSARTLAVRLGLYAPGVDSLADEVEHWLASSEHNRPV